MTVPQPDTSAQDGATPAVSVVIAVHNGMPYVDSAIRSMMDQTLREIEIIVVDDASTDETPQVLARLAEEDPRIRVLTNETNLKLAASLNRGLEVARAPLIARMDADDLSMPNRLAVQKAYMDAHPEVVLCAASVRRIAVDGRVLNTHLRDYDDTVVRWLARFSAPLVHPTFMFRRVTTDSAPLRYDPDIHLAQDFDLTVRALDHGKVVSRPDVLVDWRIHGESLSSARLDEQRAFSMQIARRVHVRDLPPDICREMEPVLELIRSSKPVSVADLWRCIRVLRRMIAYDARNNPERAHDLRQQAVRIMIYQLGGRGLSRRMIAALLPVLGPDFVLAGISGYLAARRGAAAR